MDYITIRNHPPWYARGTPVINTRDGPAMALNDKLLFAICRGPSARGEPGECKDRGQGRNESRKSEFGIRQLADRSRGKRTGITCRWLTLKSIIFNTQNNVFGQWCAVLGRKWGVGVSVFVDFDRACPALSGSDNVVRSGETDLSACAALRFVGTSSDNVKMMEMDDEMEIFDTDRACPDLSGSGD